MRFTAALALVSAAACATAGELNPPGPFPAIVSAPGSSIPSDAVVWSADRRLSWGDFLGPPQLSSPAGAVTVYVLNYEAECNGPVFSFSVLSRFLPKSSWVQTALLSNQSASGQALNHEQGHFDLSEVQARHIRRALTELDDPCEREPSELDAIVQRGMTADAETQRRYDRETRHGADLRRQADWNAVVQRLLKETAKFARGRS